MKSMMGLVTESKHYSFINRVTNQIFREIKDKFPQAVEDFRNGNTEGPQINIMDVIGQEGNTLWGQDVTIIHPFLKFWLNTIITISEDTYQAEGANSPEGEDEEGKYKDINFIMLEFTLPVDVNWQRLSIDLKMLLRHELEHLLQDGINRRKGQKVEVDWDLWDKMDSGDATIYDYFTSGFEVDAFLMGFNLKSKKLRIPFRDLFDDFMDTYSIDADVRDKIYQTWMDRAKELDLKLLSEQGSSITSGFQNIIDNAL